MFSHKLFYDKVPLDFSGHPIIGTNKGMKNQCLFIIYYKKISI